MGLEISEAENERTRPRGTNRIPPNGGVKSFSVAARVLAFGDVIEAIPVQADFVKPEIEKAERFLVI